MDIYGSDGNDILSGTLRQDEIIGRAGDDQLFGGADNDELYGGRGMDMLAGGIGNDELTGGPGNDVFIYSAGNDMIEDWHRGDIIEISATFGIDTFAQLIELASPRDDGDDTVIDFGGGNSLFLEDVQLGSLIADDFLIA